MIAGVGQIASEKGKILQQFECVLSRQSVSVTRSLYLHLARPRRGVRGMGCCASSAAGSPSTVPDEALDMLASSAENMDVSLGQFGGIDDEVFTRSYHHHKFARVD